jgi:hypothetical protein
VARNEDSRWYKMKRRGGKERRASGIRKRGVRNDKLME